MNGKPDKRSEKIRKALEHTTPVPDARFEQQLEERLLTYLHTRESDTKDETMIHILNPKRKNHETGSRVPLTLAAALAAIVLGAGLMFGTGGISRPPEFAGVIPLPQQSDMTATPPFTPTPLVPTTVPVTATPIAFPAAQPAGLENYIAVVIAARDLAVGEVITAEDISVAYWDRDFAFRAAVDLAGVWFYSDAERIIGQTVENAAARFQPISDQVLTLNDPQDEQATAFYLPPEGFIGDFSTLRTDDPARIVLLLDGESSFASSERPGTMTADESGRVISFDAIVQVGSYTINNPDGTTTTGQSARLLLTLDEAVFLQRLVDEQVPFHYTILPAS